MPYTHNQIVAARIAEHDPGRLNPENRGLLKMKPGDLHEMATWKGEHQKKKAERAQVFRRRKA